MRVELIGKAGVQIFTMRHRPQPRDIEVGLLDIAAQLGEQPADLLFAARVVDEPGLQVGQDLDVRLGVHALLGDLRIIGARTPLRSSRWQCRTASRALARGEREQVTLEEQLPTRFVIDCRLNVHRRHRCLPLRRTGSRSEGSWARVGQSSLSPHPNR